GRLRLLARPFRLGRPLGAMLAHQLVVEGELGLRLRMLPPGWRRGGDRQAYHLLLAQAARLRALPDVEAEEVDDAAGGDPGDEEDQPISQPEPAARLSRHPPSFTSARAPSRRPARARRAAPAGRRAPARAEPASARGPRSGCAADYSTGGRRRPGR